MTPQPLNKEYVTIKRAEYDALVDIAKRVAALKADGSAAIDVLHLRLERARRARRTADAHGRLPSHWLNWDNSGCQSD